ncbi:DUF262 domain-containing HNH endonuclease family protein [Bacillus sp. FSL K6-0273]|uniref:DUF262 domain-containing protein n=1 Tax=Bacillus TaxID=1386 RepID=UPI0008FE425E|nr:MULTISPECIES: DUF262 domain-containing protein [Bacillus cereus group]MDF9467035.1 DUF262 domain-containing HNH endonuclease family protein [Bacillus cereus]OJD99231.1 hypothetical protein A9489_28065 [Bacillus thuringiensis]QWS01137.1 DUF262 domain-containing protein [Bacillus cereus]
MKIKPIDYKIEDLLKGKTYIIPPFQRDFSWDKVHYEEFLHDMIKSLQVNSKTLQTTEYFLGTMLFIEGKPKEVIDGQQRLTTITIVLSVISKLLKSEGKDGASNGTYQYIMFKDNNDKLQKVLSTPNSFPYFTHIVQSNQEAKTEYTPITEEEENIQKTFDYFMKTLSKGIIFKEIKKIIHSTNVDEISYSDWLIAIRDQILCSVIISIDTDDTNQANMIFEILNAKGKKLSSIDLIKNKIFEYIGDTETDDAKSKWHELNAIMVSGKKKMNLPTFFRHYWSSKHIKVTANNLYDKFNMYIAKNKKVSDSDKCYNLINDLIIDAKYYKQIVNPNISDWGNRNEYKWLVQSLNTFENVFGVSQTRIALLGLIRAKNKGVLGQAYFKKAILFLEDFCFQFFILSSSRASKIESTLSKFSIKLTGSQSKQESNQIIEDDLFTPLSKLSVNKEILREGFVSLTFTKERRQTNVPTIYILNRISSHFSDNEIWKNDSSIEHIINEEQNEALSISIGNLILLEEKLNNKAGNKVYQDKKEIYLESSYKEVTHFVENHNDWTIEEINDRANNLFEIYYEKLLKDKLKKIEKEVVLQH